MKALKQICIAFLIMIVAVSAVTAQTENKDLPPEKELRSFIDGIDASDNYLSYITELSQTEHPTWKWDLWSDRVSFYYCDSGSSKGYGSIYLDSTGNEVAPSCSGSCKLVKSYIGEVEPINKDVVKFEADVDESEIEDEEKEIVRKLQDAYETASAEYLINENGFFEGDSDGDKLKIHNNRRALNPTYDGLMDFLKRNTIDERDYEYPTYTCGNFATDLHDAAEKEFIRAGIVVIRSKENDYAHTINMFKTVDKGYIFIDCTSDGSKDGAEDFGDCIAEFGMDGYTITSIENPKLTTTRELPGETQFSYYW